MSELNKVLEIANQEVGYVEKKSNKDLESKIDNPGNSNFTKYARDLDKVKFYNTPKNGYAWCDVFVDWCFVEAFGEERALELLCQEKGGCGAGCGFSMNYYKNKGQFHTEPKIGDQIFFKEGKSISHTGIVYNVDNSKVYTIEGNTSDVNYVDGNGGKVCKKSYSLNSNYIAGYGRPNYKEEVVSIPTQKKYTHDEFVGDVQSCIGARVDRIAGPETLSKTITISAKKNSRHPVVEVIQKYYKSLGYDEVGEIDGIAGPKFDKTTRHFQMDNGCVIDGEITARNKTWKKLLKLL